MKGEHKMKKNILKKRSNAYVVVVLLEQDRYTTWESAEKPDVPNEGSYLTVFCAKKHVLGAVFRNDPSYQMVGM